VVRALEDDRFEWEDTTDKYDKLTEYYKTNIQVNRTLNKSYLNSAQREFVDKKILFRTSDVMENCKSHDNDYYFYGSHVPDEIYTIDKKFIRSHSLQALCKVGRRKNGEKGCYIHFVC